MTLMERIAERRCRFVECLEDRQSGSDLCPEHTWAKWQHRLDRAEDGSYAPRRRFAPVDRTWERAA